MSQTRYEWKVGLFVFLGLGLLVVLLILFSKGVSFTPTYILHLKAGSAGILKKKSAVVMAGVPIGSIKDIKLAPDGRNVTIDLQIKSVHEIHGDARFAIEQSGFLGDQYVTVVPGDNVAPQLKDGDQVEAETPFDLQEVARSAQGFIKRIDETAKRLNTTIDDIRREALNEQTLTNLANSVVALNQFSEQALVTVDNLNLLIKTNGPTISTSLQNIEASTCLLSNILADIQSGKGTAGMLLQDDAVARNLAELSANLNNVSSNLNRFGFWKMLWKKSPPVNPRPPSVGKEKS